MTTYTVAPLSDPPAGATKIVPQSINNSGQVTGRYNDGVADVGFLYSHGTWTTLSDPSAAVNGPTNPAAINDAGQVVGDYANNGITEGFLYTDGTWTNINGFPTAINDKGQVTGWYGKDNVQVGFLYSNGTFTTLSDPSAGAYGTVPASINDRGQVTGYYSNSKTQVGFLYSNGGIVRVNSILPARALGRAGALLFLFTNHRRTRPDSTLKMAYTYLP